MRVGKRAPVPCFCIPFAALGRLYNPIDLPNPPAPPELPKPLKYRKRALSNDFKGSSNAQLMKMARSQKDSWLFDLPPELRNQIWKACLGGLKLHFELQMNLLRQSTWGPSGERRKNGLLSLPLTCRRTLVHSKKGRFRISNLSQVSRDNQYPLWVQYYSAEDAELRHVSKSTTATTAHQRDTHFTFALVRRRTAFSRHR